MPKAKDENVSTVSDEVASKHFHEDFKNGKPVEAVEPEVDATEESTAE